MVTMPPLPDSITGSYDYRPVPLRAAVWDGYGKTCPVYEANDGE
jgi:hypothetical protein